MGNRIFSVTDVCMCALQMALCVCFVSVCALTVLCALKFTLFCLLSSCTVCMCVCVCVCMCVFVCVRVGCVCDNAYPFVHVFC